MSGAKQPATSRPRTGARVAAVQALFQSESSGDSAETVIDQFVKHRLGDDPLAHPDDGGFDNGRVPEAHVPLFAAIVRGAAKQGDAVDAAILAHLAPGWPMHRLDPVLRAMFRAATFEFLAGGEPPARVVIKEYMDIAHGFFGGEEPRFANGVLDALARHFRPGEFGT
ncbi:NusB antitermination factor [Humitalea rosea]|uniref:Transcription antitermination protein NusB n=1 Tax=Humitalea rosea TaxID=990373 RepID=A0A2W7INH3_9PROT|nr:transcription antitermination factor NusB [Humitalea rosea]PZW49039.1 NusB antitermination factor [Humitalea rosea]